MTSFLDYDAPLHTAIRTGQLESIKTCLDQKGSFNVHDYDLLHLAASYGQVKVARLLITRYNCPVDCRNRKKQTPLHIACGKGHLTMVRMLVTEYQAKLALHDENNDTPLHEAAWCRQTEIVKCLINEFSCNPNSKGIEGKTILHLACRQGHTELFETLLMQYKLEAELLSTDSGGNIPLHDAAWGGSENILRSLITKYKCPVESRNHSKQTPLHLACSGGHLRVIRILITEYKANLNARDKDTNTPLHKAALSGQSKVILCLIKEFSCNLNTKRIDGKTILHCACHQGHTELVDTLLTQYGPGLLFIRDDKRNTPLHFAALGGNERIAKLLITKYNCLLSCENSNKEIPLDIACNKGHLNLVRLMVMEHKADLIHKALCIAAWYGQTNAMNSLIKLLNINPDHKNLDSKHRVMVPRSQKYIHEPAAPWPMPKSSAKSSWPWAVDSLIRLLDQCDQSPLSDIDKKAALLFTKYDSKQTSSSIIRIFVIEYNNTEFDKGNCDECVSLYEGVWYEDTETIEFLINEFLSSPTIEEIDSRTTLNLAIQQGYIELIKPLLSQYSINPLSADNNGNTPLHYAACCGREDIVKLFITKFNCPANVQNTNKQTPLHLAALCGHTKVLMSLIDEFSCFPKTKGHEGRTILHHACRQGHVELVETLLTIYNLDPSCVDDNGNTPLHLAALVGNEKVIEVLITKFHCLVDSVNNVNETPLHLACAGGHLKVVRMLAIDHRANLHSCDSNNGTPLHKAAAYLQIDTINCLINDCGCSPHAKGHEGRTILHHACHQGHVELVELLLTLYMYNLDPSCGDDNGCTPLHLAALGGSEEVIKLLITKYRCRVDSINNVSETPLHLACAGGHLKVVRMLVNAHGANLHTCNNNNDTPLHKAAACGHINVIKCLIKEFGCSPGTKGYEGRTILHHACHHGHMELVEILLRDHKLDPLSVDDNRNTSLHLAAMGGRVIVAKLLVTKYGFPVDCRNDIEQLPLHLACSNGHIQVVRTLLSECKADLHIRDANNSTPVHTAVFHGQIDILHCLIINEFNCSIDVKGTNSSSILHLACQQGHLELAEQLMARYKLDPTIGDDDENSLLHYAALHGKSGVAKLLIINYGFPVNHLNSNNETPLHLACTKGHLTFVRTLVREYKADIKARDINKHMPLQRAALSGQAEVVFCLISEFNCDHEVTGVHGRNLLHYACLYDHDELARQLIDSFQLSIISADNDGNSPLHISAMYGQNKCVLILLHFYHAPVYLRNNAGKSALEIASNEVTKKIINTYLRKEYEKIKYDYKKVQNLSKKKYSGAQRLTRVFVLGNVGSGKSTLIESLKRQRFLSSFNQVSEATVPPHTSEIIPSEHCHKTIGRVLYYDFAGNPEYYSSHSAIMSSVMQSEEGTNVFLLLVSFYKDDKSILEELEYWFGFISNHCVKQKEKCKVLTIGSHVDLITKSEARKKFDLVPKFTEKYLSNTSKNSIEVVKSNLIINCCKPRSSTCVHNTLNRIVKKAAMFQLSEEAAILLGLLEKDFKNVVTCKVQKLLTHIIETGVYLPNTADSLYPKVMELHTLGLLMIIESKSGKLEEYLLLLNVPKLTNKVHKLLFSKDSAEKSTDPYSASMGILPQTYLNSILPEYITTECLVQLQYCQEFTHAEVKFDEHDYSIKPTEDSSTPTLFYFPALCEKERKNTSKETERKKSIKTPEDTYKYSISWYLKCKKMFDYLPPRFLHVLLLRLAHAFALPREYDHSPVNADITATIQLYNRRCTMWKNGIHWLMEEGVECFVENVNNSKGIVVITKSEEALKSICTEMLFNIIREIHQAKEEFCEAIKLQEYLMDSDDPTAFTDEDKLFLTCDIARVLKKGKPYIISANGSGNTRIKAEKISYLTNYVQWGKY